MEPIENYGVKVLSIGFFTKPDQAVVWRGPMAAKALNQMIFDAAWGALDFLLIDLPPGTGDIHLSIVQSLPLTGAVVVSTPQNVALADAKKGIAMFQQQSINVPVLGIIENMSYFTPAVLQDQSALATHFNEITKKLVTQTLLRNENLPPTKAVEITNLVGCEAVKS
jgi:ATP-binding protein involved in chromosome partitioning